ncbi:MAG: rod shape-determining protein MreC [Candidatus Pelagibacterales bacterium]|nr:MAG: rod shape-determining protein MreC [Pelagibacterales bacterium]
METSRDDVGIAIRSAFLTKSTKQKFSLFALIILSIALLFTETIETKPLNFFRAFVKDAIYRGALVVSAPSKSINNFSGFIKEHLSLYDDYGKLKKENSELKNQISGKDFLELENNQLRRLIDEQISSSSNLLSARVMLDKQSPYLNSFIINIGSNKKIKNGMAVLDSKNFIGRIVDVNYFSSRVLLVSDLNSKIPIITEPSAHHAILSGHGKNKPTLEYLPENHNIKNGDKVYTSGREGIFSPGIPIGKVRIEDNVVKVLLFSDLSQITFVNINLENINKIE